MFFPHSERGFLGTAEELATDGLNMAVPGSYYGEEGYEADPSAFGYVCCSSCGGYGAVTHLGTVVCGNCGQGLMSRDSLYDTSTHTGRLEDGAWGYGDPGSGTVGVKAKNSKSPSKKLKGEIPSTALVGPSSPFPAIRKPM